MPSFLTQIVIKDDEGSFEENGRVIFIISEFCRKEMYRLLSHKSPVNSVSFSEDGTKIISSSENTIKVWDVATGVLISNNMKPPWRIQYSNVSPNSKYIVSVNNDNKESLLSVWKYLPFKDLIENTIQRFKSFMLNDEEKLRYNLP